MGLWVSVIIVLRDSFCGGCSGVIFFESVGGLGGVCTLFVLMFGLIIAGFTKSAGWILHVWLPDAMEGPVPVSSLVHSATLVVCGVWLVGSIDLVLCAFGGGVILLWVWTSCVLFGLLGCIFVLLDVKRGVAYGTITQMNLALFVICSGDWQSGVVLFIVHGFYKSSMFMCIGLWTHGSGGCVVGGGGQDYRSGGVCGGGTSMCFSFGVVCVIVIMSSVWGWSGWVVKEIIGEIWISYRWNVGLQLLLVWWCCILGVSIWCLGILCVLRFVSCGGGGGGVVRVCGDGLIVVGMVGWFGVGGVFVSSLLCFDLANVGLCCTISTDTFITSGIGGCSILFGSKFAGLLSWLFCFAD